MWRIEDKYLAAPGLGIPRNPERHPGYPAADGGPVHQEEVANQEGVFHGA